MIIASNRGPVYHEILSDGSLQVKASSGGGLVTALKPLITSGVIEECIWVAAAISEGDHRAAEESQGLFVQSGIENTLLSYVTVPPDQYHKYYNMFANPILWFVQHNIWDYARMPRISRYIHDAWWNGYVPVNEAFANAIIKTSEQFPGAPIMLQDYHLYLVGEQVRKALPEAVITHFLHIPWPGASCWRMLPPRIVFRILESILSCDIFGVQTERDSEDVLVTFKNFMRGLEHIEVDFKERAVKDTLKNRTTYIRAYPISIDPEEVRRVAYSDETEEYVRQLKDRLAEGVENLIVFVGRLDPSKNFARVLEAFELLLGQEPDLRGKVSLVAYLVPTREQIEVYTHYRNDVMEYIEKINEIFGNEGGGGWEPIIVFNEENQCQAFAGLRLYDVLMVNSVMDGMNLVAKEGPIVNERDGVLILSPTTGAYEELGVSTIEVAAPDVQGTFEAMYVALRMGDSEKKLKSKFLQTTVRENDIHRWFARQLEDIANLPAVARV